MWPGWRVVRNRIGIVRHESLWFDVPLTTDEGKLKWRVS